MSRIAFLLLLVLCGFACGDDTVDPEPVRGLVTNLIEGVQFPNATLVREDFPDAQGADATLLPIGEQVVVEPGASGIMALEVEDEASRPIAATLLQFDDQQTRGGESSYTRIPVEAGQQSTDVVENSFDAEGDVCDGVCQGLFRLRVFEAIEFDNGDVTSRVRREILVDCSADGDPEMCDLPQGGGQSAALVEEGVVCGDVEAGELVYTGRPLFDGHFGAVAAFGDASASLRADLDGTLGALAELFDADGDDAAAVAAAAAEEVATHTESGLSLRIGEIGCGARTRQIEAAIARCAPDALSEVAEGVPCAGDCRLSQRGQTCGEDAEGRCRGLDTDIACDGECTGSCTVELSEPAVCEGTCRGSCSGACPSGEEDECFGPCEGECTGECRSPSVGPCEGTCTGLCDAVEPAADTCPGDTVRYCVPTGVAPVECRGACFGDIELSGLPAACGSVPVARGRIHPLCEPTLVQVSFAFAPDVEATAQTDFAALTDALNAPLRDLYEILARADLLARVGEDLATDATDHVEPAIDDGEADAPAIQCARDQAGAAVGRVEADLSQLSSAQAEAMSILDSLTMSQEP